MRFGYNTNGFAHHRLEDTLAILASLGYESVALTLDYHALDPFSTDFPRQRVAVNAALKALKLRSVIETGARFLLNPHKKHQPTLISANSDGREVRLQFLKHAIELAADLGSGAVSFWSGTADEAALAHVLMDRLVSGCLSLCDYASQRNVRLAFEPEPGMFIDTMTAFADLERRVNHPQFGLTLDIGHLHCQGETPIAQHIQRWRAKLWNVHIEDMRRGVHDHLMFGDGDIDFPPVLAALADIGYAGGIHVELSRHSHDAVETARRAIAFLRDKLSASPVR